MGAVKFMDGWDYLQGAGGYANYKPFLLADGWYGTLDFGTGSPGIYATEGRFGLGASFTLGSPPGGTGAYKALDWRWTAGYIFGIAVQIVGSNNHQFRLYDGQTNSYPFTVTLNTSGILEFNIRGVTYRTRTGAVRNNTWFYLQVKHIGDVIVVLINGEYVVNITSGAPSPGPFDAYRLSSGFNSGETRFDDFYIIDPLEDGPYDDFLGNIVVRDQLAIANGDNIDWTPNAAGYPNNWQNVTDVSMTSANYNYTDTVGDYDLYQMAANAAARDIFCLQLKGSFTQDNGVQLYAANRLKTGGNLYSGPQFGVNQINGYATISSYWDLNPDTGVAWTNTDLNSLQAGPILAASD